MLELTLKVAESWSITESFEIKKTNAGDERKRKLKLFYFNFPTFLPLSPLQEKVG